MVIHRPYGITTVSRFNCGGELLRPVHGLLPGLLVLRIAFCLYLGDLRKDSRLDNNMVGQDFRG